MYQRVTSFSINTDIIFCGFFQRSMFGQMLHYLKYVWSNGSLFKKKIKESTHPNGNLISG